MRHPDLVTPVPMAHHPDLIAAVQAEALARYGLILPDWRANAALLYLSAARQPWESPPQRGPEHEAAAAAREVWQVENGRWPAVDVRTP